MIDYNFENVNNRRNGTSSIFESEYLRDRINSKCIDDQSINIDDFEVLQSIADKPINCRQMNDFSLISHIIAKSDFFVKLKDHNLIEPAIFQRMILSLSQVIKFKKILKDQVIFYEGDEADFFYIILWGELNIIKHKQKETRMNGREYINLLIQLKNSKNKDLFVKTVDQNQSVFPVNKRDFDKLDNILANVRLRKSLMEESRGFSEIKEIINRFENENFIKSSSRINIVIPKNSIIEKLKVKNDTSIQVKITNDKGSQISENEECKNLILNKMKRPILNRIGHEIDVVKYDYITSNVRRKVKVFSRFDFMKLKFGDYFGEQGFLNKDRKRNSTLVSQTNVLLGLISEDFFVNYLKELLKKIANIQVVFLHENFYFSQINQTIFKSSFMGEFAFTSINKGENLIVQNEEIQKIYYIKEGEVEISISIDLESLTNVIMKLSKLINQKNDDLKIFSNPNDESVSEFKKIRHLSISLVGLNQTIGLTEYFFKIPSICKYTVHSNIVKCYSIQSQDHKKILKHEPSIYSNLCKIANNKLKILISRLTDIRNSEIERISSDTFSKNKEKLINGTGLTSEKIRNTDKIVQRISTIVEKLDLYNPLLTSPQKDKLDNKNLKYSTGLRDKLKIYESNISKSVRKFSDIITYDEKKIKKSSSKNSDKEKSKKLSKFGENSEKTVSTSFCKNISSSEFREILSKKQERLNQMLEVSPIKTQSKMILNHQKTKFNDDKFTLIDRLDEKIETIRLRKKGKNEIIKSQEISPQPKQSFSQKFLDFNLNTEPRIYNPKLKHLICQKNESIHESNINNSDYFFNSIQSVSLLNSTTSLYINKSSSQEKVKLNRRQSNFSQKFKGVIRINLNKYPKKEKIILENLRFS